MKTGFYFETTKEKADLKASGFHWTRKRKDATDRNHCLSIGRSECWSGIYDEKGFSRSFFIHKEYIELINI